MSQAGSLLEQGHEGEHRGPAARVRDIDLSAGAGDKWPQTDIRTSPAGNDMLIGKPQTGGWPAHRCFNSSTGLDGKPYPRQTEEQMCEEMSDPKRMRDYIE